MTMPDFLQYERIRKELRGILLTLAMVGAVTLVVSSAVAEVGLEHGSVLYLIPVLIAATRWGVVAAIVAAVGGVLASAFLFYPPLYSFRIRDPQEVLNLVLFIVVAIVVSQLASRLRRQVELARQREIDMRDLYAFSRRLAVAFDVSDIHAAIEDHLANRHAAQGRAVRRRARSLRQRRTPCRPQRAAAGARRGGRVRFRPPRSRDRCNGRRRQRRDLAGARSLSQKSGIRRDRHQFRP